ncbi:MAG TPA: single-stranded DNA-binding protein, partial [bacterium]|nr:single-stranded DNA-binding protein [bacterium]
MEGLKNFNKVILVGRLTQTPELRYTPKGAAVARMNIAVNQKRNKKTETLFIDVIALNKLAEFCSQYFKKGKGIYIEGGLSMKKWTAEDKTEKTKIEVLAD